MPCQNQTRKLGQRLNKFVCLFVTEEVLITVSRRAPERKLGQAPITIVPNF